MKIVLKNMLRLHKKYKDDSDVFIGSLQNSLPLPQSGGYPLFKNFPNESVEFSAKQRVKLIMEQEAAEKKAVALEQLKLKTAQLLQKEIQFREQ